MTERDRQKKFILSTAVNLSGDIPELNLLVPIPNGGCADLALFVPRFPLHGLFIMIEVDGQLMPGQKIWQERLQNAGYAVVACSNENAAIKAISSYLYNEYSEYTEDHFLCIHNVFAPTQEEIRRAELRAMDYRKALPELSIEKSQQIAAQACLLERNGSDGQKN